MRLAYRNTIVLGLTAIVLGLAGCGTNQTLNITGAQAKLVAEENSATFLDRISSVPRVTENDAMRGTLMLLDGQDNFETFEQRVKSLADRNIVARSWNFQADRPITKGRLAYMVYQSCGMQGGIMLSMTGPTQRYCLKELQYKQMMVQGSGLTPVTGMEFIAILTRADTFRQTGEVPNLVNETSKE